jgi:hypothetical protein
MASNFNKGYNVSLDELNKGSGPPEWETGIEAKGKMWGGRKQRDKYKTNNKKVK